MNPQELDGSKNLLSNNDTIKDVVVEAHTTEPLDASKAFDKAIDAQQAAGGPPMTEVTTLAKEDQKAGKQTKMPSPEEMVARAGSSLISNLTHLSNLIESRKGGKYAISRKGMNRLLISILDLPQDGIPVLLNGQNEKVGFAIGQRVIADRFIITQHHINEEVKSMRAEAARNEASKSEENKLTVQDNADIIKAVEETKLTTQGDL